MPTRRELLVLLGALAVPLASLAQQGRVPRLGYLDAANLEPTLGLFRSGLRELGYVEGQNLLMEVRSADGKPGALPALAAELVAMKVDVIVAIQTPAVLAAKQSTTSIPIVMSAGDPVGTGLIASLARPGGNITGRSSTTAEISAKILELFRDIRPAIRSVAVLANVADPFTKPFLEQLRSSGRNLSIEIRPAMVRGPGEYDAVFAAWVKAKVDAVIIQPSLPRGPAIELANKHQLLSASPTVPFAADGGLIAYATSIKEHYQKLAIYVEKILKGARPADLPVEQPTKFELVINMKTAKALGLTIPQSILFRADRVIE